MKKFIIAILVLSVVAVVWASRTPKKTSDYGDSACDSTPEMFGSGPAQQSIKGVQVLSEQICDGGSGSFPLNCSTSVRDFVYLVSLPSNSPQVITRFAISVSGAPSGFNPNFGLMLCSSGPERLDLDGDLELPLFRKCLQGREPARFLRWIHACDRHWHSVAIVERFDRHDFRSRERLGSQPGLRAHIGWFHQRFAERDRLE
jgi:hypothetical protein